MRRYIWAIIFGLSLYHNSIAQIEFKYSESPLHYRIDLKKKEFQSEAITGVWNNPRILNFINIDESQFTGNPKFEAFLIKGHFYLILDGTGQVYKLNTKDFSFSRIDKTFFRGYNFKSIKFSRNDTLFSFGGMGFWHSNNIETYFSPDKLEWELYNMPTEDGPKNIINSFGGYNTKRDIISVFEIPPLYISSNKPTDYRYFEKKPDEKNWELKGNLNIPLLKKLGINDFRANFIQGIYFFRDGLNSALGDPVKNEIYFFEKDQDILNANYELSGRNGILFSYYKQSFPEKGSLVKIDSTTILELKSKGKLKGKFYVNDQVNLEIYIILGIIVLIIIIAIWKIKRVKSEKESSIKSHESTLENKLPDGAFALLKQCLNHPKGFEFSSQIFTEYMGYSNYSYETQRQIRSKLIKAINAYFKVHHQLDEVIIRKPAINDKRFSIYLISEQHYDTLVSLFNQ